MRFFYRPDNICDLGCIKKLYQHFEENYTNSKMPDNRSKKTIKYYDSFEKTIHHLKTPIIPYILYLNTVQCIFKCLLYFISVLIFVKLKSNITTIHRSIFSIYFYQSHHILPIFLSTIPIKIIIQI